MTRNSRQGRFGSDTPVNMAAMIDVVFLLLVFFVLTVRPTDIEASLETSRGAPGGDAVPLLTIDVRADGYLMNGKRVTLAEMDRHLTKLAGISSRQSLVVACAYDSAHSGLVKVLDLCAKAELRNISLMSR